MDSIKFHQLKTSKLQSPEMTAFPTENNNAIRIHFKYKINMDKFSEALKKINLWKGCQNGNRGRTKHCPSTDKDKHHIHMCH